MRKTHTQNQRYQQFHRHNNFETIREYRDSGMSWGELFLVLIVFPLIIYFLIVGFLCL